MGFGGYSCQATPPHASPLCSPCLIPCWPRAAPRTPAFQLCLLYLESLPQMPSLEVKGLGSSQGLTVTGTHIPVPRGMSNGDVLVPACRQLGAGGRAWLVRI